MRHRKFGRTRISKSGRAEPSTCMQSVVGAMVRERGWSNKLYEEHILGVWESVVGKDIARHTAPVSLLDGILRVDVRHQLYARELLGMKIEILSKLDKKLQGLNSRGRRFDQKHRVVDIRFRFNPKISQMKKGENGGKIKSNQQQKVDDIQKDAKSISPELLARVEAAVSVVNDNDLQEALKSLFLAQCKDMESTR